MKQLFLEFYNTLSITEKRNFIFGTLLFSIGMGIMLYVLFPPSWNNWEETTGDLISAQSLSKGAFSGGTTLYTLRFSTQQGEIKEGTFTMSPIVLSTMKRIRVFYKQDNATVFYVHNPTTLVIGLAMVLLGGGLLLTYGLYYRDKLRGIDYE
jgi:hypothetical protein